MSNIFQLEAQEADIAAIEDIGPSPLDTLECMVQDCPHVLRTGVL